MTLLTLVQLLDPDLLTVAHEIGQPHQEPARKSDEGGGSANTIVVIAGVVVTLLLVAGLVWLKERTRRMDRAEEGPEPTA